MTAAASSVYTVNGVTFTDTASSGNNIGNTKVFPGGLPVTVASHTFSLPGSASGGATSVDGTLTPLQTQPSSSNTTQKSSESSSMSSSQAISPGSSKTSSDPPATNSTLFKGQGPSTNSASGSESYSVTSTDSYTKRCFD